ncbi:MAG: hypothetical protein PHV17_02470 [Candidatus Omnitrophica bacterium]|nr:hypothetical protein [Candidatus Omnitrophota bacterium]
MSDKYQMIEAGDIKLWDDLVKASDQGTIFTDSAYLCTLGRKYCLNFIYQGEQLKAGVALILSDDSSQTELDELVIYNGILFKSDQPQRKNRARFERFEITEFIINQLVKKYNKVQMTLSPHFEDFRPFLWHNYHFPDKPRFCLTLKYTSYLNISSLSQDCPENEIPAFKELDRLKQRHIRQARKDGIVTKLENKTADFIGFYKQLIESQGYSVSNKKLKRMENLANYILDEQKAVSCVTYDSSGQIIYITIFGFDSKRAYSIFGAPNPKASQAYKGAICFWDAFKILSRDYSIDYLDLEGVNSPQRGWFKLGFGGTILPYFQVSLK